MVRRSTGDAKFNGPNSLAIMPGMQISTSDGQHFIVVDVYSTQIEGDEISTYVGIKRSTWWRRLYWRTFWRLRRWFF